MYFFSEEGQWVTVECEICRTKMTLSKDLLKYNSFDNTYTLNEPLECFCENESKTILNVPSKNNNSQTENISASYLKTNTPHCPTCGSENVQKISFGAKAISGAMFGILSDNIRKTYHCNNCGYKW